MIMVDRLAQDYYMEHINEDELQDYKSEVKHLVHWFRENEKILKQKYEYFYGSTEKDPGMIANVRNRKIRRLYEEELKKNTSKKIQLERFHNSMEGQHGTTIAQKYKKLFLTKPTTTIALMVDAALQTSRVVKETTN